MKLTGFIINRAFLAGKPFDPNVEKNDQENHVNSLGYRFLLFHWFRSCLMTNFPAK